MRGGLQVFPQRTPEEFDTMDEFWDYLEEVSRYNNGLPPKGKERLRAPLTSDAQGGTCQVGLRLAPDDYELLKRQARDNSVPPSTFARVIVVRVVRASAEAD